MAVVDGSNELVLQTSMKLSARLIEQMSSSTKVEYPCNIRKIYNSEPFSKGSLNISTLSEPVIFVRNSDYQSPMARLMDPEKLIIEHGDLVVRLSSSNTYSRDILEMTLSDYLELLDSYDVGTAANETFYLFGGNMGPFWDEIISSYRLPGCKYCQKAGAVTPGIGGLRSGVSFHYHGPGFSETVYGGKRWFLYPPHHFSGGNLAPKFGPNVTMATWVSDVYPTLTTDLRQLDINLEYSGDEIDANTLKPLECVIYPGEVLFFPDMWSHATLNVDKYTVFVSVFLDLQLMRDD
jgi:hypothetical protein